MEEPTANVSIPRAMRPPAVAEHAEVLKKLGEDSISLIAPGDRLRYMTLRDIVAVIFRHKTLLITSFLVIFLGVILGTWMLPRKYETSMKILVKRERVDPVVTPSSNTQLPVVREVTLEDLNSEVELLKSRDLLEKVVVSCGLHMNSDESFLSRTQRYLPHREKAESNPDSRIPQAVLELEKNLIAWPIDKSKMIEVYYSARDPNLAARVLQTLSELYLEKHLAVHRPPGALDFFEQQTEQYKKGLAAAEKQLAAFNRNEGVVSVEIEKDITLRKLSDTEAQLRETQAARAALEQRIKLLEAQAAATPERIVTQVRTLDNSNLLQQIKSKLLDLEMKRAELLTKYDPEYRAVKEIDGQIAQARDALDKAEKNPIREESTDLDRTRQWLDEELARARAERAALDARETQVRVSLESYRESARRIGSREIPLTDLERQAKTAEENYLLYLRKQEEARISDALDRKHIVNVAIAEAATVPATPAGPNWRLNLILGFTLAFLTSIGLAIAADYIDPTFRTPNEVAQVLGIPVIASLPRN